jgi:hypothetical protein
LLSYTGAGLGPAPFAFCPLKARGDLVERRPRPIFRWAGRLARFGFR